MGVAIRHPFDFSNCKSLRFTLKNDSDLSYYFSVSLDEKGVTGRFDRENFRVGFTDCCDTPYYEIIKHVRKVGYDMYAIRAGKQ